MPINPAIMSTVYLLYTVYMKDAKLEEVTNMNS
jgi:hypothetical protein